MHKFYSQMNDLTTQFFFLNQYSKNNFPASISSRDIVLHEFLFF